jgi:hypothetical protein
MRGIEIDVIWRKLLGQHSAVDSTRQHEVDRLDQGGLSSIIIANEYVYALREFKIKLAEQSIVANCNLTNHKISPPVR